MLNKLTNKKIAILSADGFEKVELTIPLKALKVAGADVDIISLHSGHIRAMNMHKPAGTVKVDRLVSDVSPEDYDGLLIPGGHINPDLLRQSNIARTFVKEFFESGRPIASICHGPWLLASADLVSGKTLTSWPGIRDDLVNAGATWVNQKVVADGNLVTSRGPQDLMSFIPMMIELFEHGSIEEQMNTQFEESDPQVDEPPMLVMETVRFVSGFPYKWAALAGVAGLGIYGVMTGKGGFGKAA